MRAIAMIPARYEATRFPFKLMQALGDKTVIRHTYDNTVATGLFDEVLVITDSEIILNEILKNGGQAVMSKQQHESGSDRIAEAAADITADVILNVQGDEPFVNRPALAALLDAFKDPSVQVGSLMKKITDPALVNNSNIVKVVVDQKMNSLLFSRSAIPYHRDKEITPIYYEHIGVYGFRKEALMQFTRMPMTALEKIEKIECLRYLENGIPLRMVITEEAAVKIDVPEDLEKAKKYLESLKSR
jgi:3-deoxy-D-manno-octulosonate cytidylyltransferase